MLLISNIYFHKPYFSVYIAFLFTTFCPNFVLKIFFDLFSTTILTN